MKINPLLFIWLLGGCLFSCSSGNHSSERAAVQAGQPSARRLSTLVEPAGNIEQVVGTDVALKLAIPDSLDVDSLHLYLAGSLVESRSRDELQLEDGTAAFLLSTGELHPGQTGLRVRVFFAGGLTENHSRQLRLLSDLKPRHYSYRTVREYPHDREAYTQGLQYVDGELFEGTGNYGTSSLRRVDLESGEVLQIRNLDAELFGEGISVMGDRIFQLTYKSQVGFIYDKQSFEEIQKVYYQNREGWGLTHNGEDLIMSDGTHVLYFLDPSMFTTKRQLEVFDQEGEVTSLNELEYIRGKIWANRYYTDEIVIIDPQSGKVEGRVNLKGILKAADRQPSTDVLNGIAWDEKGERIFVTGKFWPKLFEIRLVELGE